MEREKEEKVRGGHRNEELSLSKALPFGFRRVLLLRDFCLHTTRQNGVIWQIASLRRKVGERGMDFVKQFATLPYP